MKVEKPFIRTPYNYDRDQASSETGIDCSHAVDPETGELVATPSLAKQSFAEECDINTIARRFGITGELPTGVRMPSYADFLDVPSYDDAMIAIREADESFMSMPAEIRARFQNDPHQFVEFCSDEKNRDQAIQWGMIPREDGPAAVAGVPGVAPAAPATPEAPPKA